MKSTRRNRRKKQTRRKKRGGEKLGEGKNGMVISPAIACKTTDTAGKVSKVFFEKEKFDTTKNSIAPVLIKLEKIDPEQKHFLYPEFCDEIGELSEENKEDGVTEENKNYSYLMKFGEGQTLLKFITETKPSEDQIVVLLKQVQELLNILHKNNIVHGDFHSENVLRMNDGTFRIIDFDVARMVDLNTDEDGSIKNEIEMEGYYIVEDVSRATDLNFERLVAKVFP
jgi:serine/threonine protein kinase